MKRLILVRHGETEWNRVGRYQGFARTSLNERGRRQAEHTARRLVDWDIDALYTSDLPRALETAEPIAGRLGLRINSVPALREADVGDWEGLTVPEIKERHTKNWRAWVEDPVHTPRAGGESLAELAERVSGAFDRFAEVHAGGTVLAVTHGGPIKSLVCTVVGFGLRFRMQLKVGNASITVLVHEYGHWRLERLNDTGHLDCFEP